MPVLVTAADAGLARLIALRLLQAGGEVRAFCTRGGDVRLRASGAILAHGALDDEGHLEAALEHVHTVVHVGIGLLSPGVERAVPEARTVAAAAANAGVRRVIAVSVAGASPAAADPLRRIKGEVEELLAAAPVPTVVIRASLVDTPRLRAAAASLHLDSDADPTVAPVRRRDLVELVAAIDDLRSTADEGHVVFAANGPERVQLSACLAALASRAGQGDGAVGRRFVGDDTAPLLRPALAGPWIAEAPFDGWGFTGLQPAAPGA